MTVAPSLMPRLSRRVASWFSSAPWNLHVLAQIYIKAHSPSSEASGTWGAPQRQPTPQPWVPWRRPQTSRKDQDHVKVFFFGEISKNRSMKCSHRRASPGCGWCHPPQSPWQALLQSGAHVRLLWRKLLEWTFSLDLSGLRVCISWIKDQYFYIWCQLHFPCSWIIALGQ